MRQTGKLTRLRFAAKMGRALPLVPALRHDKNGAIAVLGAAAIAAVIAAGAFAVELGNAYLVKAQNQQIADIAAIASALSDGNATVTTNTASNIVQINGYPASSVSANLGNSPTGDGNSGISVSVTTSVPLHFAQVVGLSSGISVSSSSWAEIKTATLGCIIGLSSSGNSISQSGGSTVTGTGCAINGVSNISISGGASLTAQEISAGGTVSISNSTVTTTPKANNIHSGATVTDPVAGDSALSSAFTSLSSLSGTVANPTTPSGGATLTFAWSPSGPSDPSYPYYSGTGGVYNKGTLPCTSGSYAFNSIKVNGGVSVNIAVTPGCNYTVANGINNGGALLEMTGDAGSWYVNGGLSAGYSSVILGGATTYWIGGGVSVGSGTLELGTATTIKVNGGISMGGGATLTASANVYQIQGTASLEGTVNWSTNGTGASTNFYNGLAINSGTFTFGDGNYAVNGSLTINGGGIVYFGNAELLIDGSLTVDGGGSLCGTPSPCGSGTSTLTIVDNGANTFDGGSTSDISAPASGATYGIPGIAIASNSAGSQTFSGGTSGNYSGVMYFPNATATFDGGAGTNANGADCLEIVANVVAITGGSTTASTCTGLGGTDTTTVVLVQ